MRDYRFRGKRKDNGKWVYGFYAEYTDISGKKRSFIIIPCDEHGNFVSYEVDPETVGQYIGRHDKNGRKAYEGDIINISRGLRLSTTSLTGIYEIYFDAHGFRIKKKSKMYTEYAGLIESDVFEIVGNRYDNPELLEGVEP